MCCEAKFPGYISFRIASLVFGYIIAIISAAGTIGFFIGLFICLSIIIGNGHHAEAGAILIAPVLIQFTSSFVCSVFLLIGLTQKKPKLVAPYLIYGMIQVVLLFCFFIVLRCVSDWFLTDHLFMAFFTVGVYSLCLFLVYVEYQRMIAQPTFENIQPALGPLAPGPQYIAAPQNRY